MTVDPELEVTDMSPMAKFTFDALAPHIVDLPAWPTTVGIDGTTPVALPPEPVDPPAPPPAGVLTAGTLVIGHSNAYLWGNEMAIRHPSWFSGGIPSRDFSEWFDTMNLPPAQGGLLAGALGAYRSANGGDGPTQIVTVISERFKNTQIVGINAALAYFELHLPAFIERLLQEAPRVILRSREYGGWALQANGEPGTSNMNAIMEAAATEAGGPAVSFVDVWWAGMPRSMFRDDGVHPNEAGVDWICDTFESKVLQTT
jgi:hypothetical protein